MRLLKRTQRPSFKRSFPGVFFLITLFLCLICPFTLWPDTARAADPALQWDVNSDADYYIVYWRTEGDSEPIDHSDPIDAATTSFPLYSSEDGTTYYYSVKAFNACGNSSDFSVEVQSAYSPYSQKDQSPTDTYAVEMVLPQATIFEAGVLIDFSANVSVNGVLTTSGNVTWTSCLDGLIGTGADISATLSVGTHTVMVSVTDGENVVASDTIVLNVLEGNASPGLTITTPVSGNLDENGHTFTFTGQASDKEDGDLSNTIAWLSDLDGGLGTGASISAALSAGKHVITARVKDSTGQVTEDSITVTADKWDAPPVLTVQASELKAADDIGGQTCTLTGKAQDEEDGDLSGTIFWFSGTCGVIGTGSSITATLSAGTNHVIFARVVDSVGQRVREQINISTEAYNFPPELSMSMVPSGEPDASGQAVTLSGSAQDTEDGDISQNISWSSSIDGTLGSGKSLQVILASGDHVITAQINDSQGKTTKIQQTITIEPYNHAPELSIRAATAGELGSQGQPYTLSGSATDKEDGDLSSAIVWSSNLKSGELGTGSSLTVTLAPGTHTITARVNDSSGVSVEASKSITISAFNSPPRISIDSVKEGVSNAEGQTFQLTGSAEDTEDGALNSGIVWTSSLDGQLGTGASLSVTLSSGTHTLTASVTDSQGQTSQSTQTVVVNLYNQEPQVAITGATAGTLTQEGQPYTFSGTASDEEDGDLKDGIVWSSSLDGTLGTGSSVSLVLTPGNHVIHARVTDSGGKSTSVSRDIVVESFNFNPTIRILKALAGDQDETGQTFTLSASAEDEEDGALSEKISWSSSLQGALGTGAGCQVHLKAGTHTITAQVKDSYGNKAEDTTRVTSVAEDFPPVLSALDIAEGKASRNGQVFTFSCTASDKEDGDLSSKILWTSSAVGVLGSGSVIQNMMPLGKQTITARVTDSQGQSTETTREFTAAWVNQEPEVRILSIDAGSAGKGGQIFTFAGAASDKEDGDLSGRIVWTSDLDGDLGEGAELMVTLTEGTHTISALVTDQDGAESRVDSTVTVEHFNVPPELAIDSVIAKTADDKGQVFEFTGRASDEEDGDLSSSIVWSSDLDGVLGTGSRIEAHLSDGEHTIRALVTDSRNKTAEQTMVTTAVAAAETGLMIEVSASSFYYFKIVNVTWSGGTTNVYIMKNNRTLSSGGPEGTKYFWFSGAGRYKVCEVSGGECSEEVVVK